MTEKQKKFLELVNKAMPKMTDLEQEKLLAFGEGLAFMTKDRAFPQLPAQQDST